MKVSLNWIKLMNQNYGCSSSSELDDVQKLIEKIGAQLGAVEEVMNLGERYKGIVVAKVISADKHPNADKLKVCRIDDAGKVKDVIRNENGQVQVVCGAPNVAAGQLVAWLPPGSIVPSTFDKDPFVLEAREIRGQISNGMIGSPKELALGDNHQGILVLDDGKPGEDFSFKLFLDDYIIDIENKMFTHRPDCFGILGIARELAGISGKTFKSPDWYREDAGLPTDGRKNVLKLSIKNDIPKLVPRFCAVAIKDVKVGDSPVWLQSFLARSGIRPINNIVDITNWFMLATAQPLHAYDYDKIKTGVLGARLSKDGEKLSLLNGKEITLDDGAVVITDGQKPIGLGGVMGGADTEVDENTRNIILECASFDMNQTRKTAMHYGIFTDAATRFTKNQSPRQNLAVLVKTAHDTLELAGGRLASPIIDDNHFDKAPKPVKVSVRFINSRLGTDLTGEQMKKLLQNVEFQLDLSSDILSVTAPFWRTDIEIPEDIVEEVGRLHGYDKLPLLLPKRDLSPAIKNPLLEFKMRIRRILSEFGANEVLTYSFVHADLMEKTSQDQDTAYKLSNALSPDLQYYRFNIIPSLLARIHPNIKAGFDEFALFEIGKGHDKNHQDKAGLPMEFELLSLVYADSSKSKAPAFYDAKKYLSALAGKLDIELEFKPVKELPAAPLAQAYEPTRAAMVSTAQGKFLGIMGEFKESVRRQLKLPLRTAGFEIDIQALADSAPSIISYRPLNKFPQLEQDFTLRSASDIPYAGLYRFMTDCVSGLSEPHGHEFEIKPLDIFQKDDDKKHKQTTWRIILWNPERTLTTQETNKLLELVAAKAKKELNAERV